MVDTVARRMGIPFEAARFGTHAAPAGRVESHKVLGTAQNGLSLAGECTGWRLVSFPNVSWRVS
jgi:hypothetical protein